MLLTLAILGIVVGFNNTAVSMALGSLGQRDRAWRVVLVFGLVEFATPLAGMLVRQGAARIIETWAGRLSPFLLAVVGLWTLWSAWRGGSHAEGLAERATSWKGLVLLALGLSGDNIVVGYSLDLAAAHPFIVAADIGLFSAVFSWLGLTIGDRASLRWEKAARYGSGAAFLGLALADWLGWI